MDACSLGLNTHQNSISLLLPMANRHGLIAGATGTGKTVTLQRMAEEFSRHGVCVFTADVKGDLSGLAYPAEDTARLQQCIKELKLQDYTPQGNPVVFWDVYGQYGHPVRTTLRDMGPLLLGRLLNLNEVQQGVLNVAFSVADDEEFLLLDLKDLQSVLAWMQEDMSSLNPKYGHVSSVSIGTIQRGLLTLETAGGDRFFGEPCFKVDVLLQKDPSGLGVIHILDATKLISDSRLYSIFLLWLLSKLYETLPEVGDLDKPKLVFFFDEAHLLFDSAPKILLDKIEQIVRLIRSKGVGVYFITQSPLDVPEDVLGQLGNRVQHALRAFTPKDQKAVKVAAQTFRANPEFNTADVISTLGVGEALVSVLDKQGTPTPVERLKIYPPRSRMGSISAQERENICAHSFYRGQYEQTMDRESAYELLQKRTSRQNVPKDKKVLKEKRSPGRPKDSMVVSILKSTARTFGSQLGHQFGEMIRRVLGSVFRK